MQQEYIYTYVDAGEADALTERIIEITREWSEQNGVSVKDALKFVADMLSLTAEAKFKCSVRLSEEDNKYLQPYH